MPGSVGATSLNALSFDLEDWYQVLYFGGGGYFRLLPYRAVRWALRRINRAGIPAVVYIHPRELDPGHPVVPVRRSHRVRHYVNLKRTEAKLRCLLTDFRFVPMGELYAAVRGSLH
ncbi:MAG: DUF3473 domain-containing protein [Nitrospiraceae bacterium]|nr:DUF3473 domain-containing protein [Nitrospiraceae bacterium]